MLTESRGDPPYFLSFLCIETLPLPLWMGGVGGMGWVGWLGGWVAGWLGGVAGWLGGWVGKGNWFRYLIWLCWIRFALNFDGRPKFAQLMDKECCLENRTDSPRIQLLRSCEFPHNTNAVYSVECLDMLCQ